VSDNVEKRFETDIYIYIYTHMLLVPDDSLLNPIMSDRQSR